MPAARTAQQIVVGEAQTVSGRWGLDGEGMLRIGENEGRMLGLVSPS